LNDFGAAAVIACVVVIKVIKERIGVLIVDDFRLCADAEHIKRNREQNGRRCMIE